MFKRIISFSLAFLLVMTIFLTTVSYFVNNPSVHNQTYPTTEGNTISILLLDGLSKSIFKKNLEEGKLPNIQQLMDKGTYVKNGIGSFPSMTGYAFYPFITGQDATESGIYGLRWFDRQLDKGNLRNYVGRTNVQMNLDINPSPKNIFELSGKQYTSSINSYMNRGVKHSEMTGWKHTTSKYGHLPFFRSLAAIPYFGKRITADFFAHETYTMQLAKKQLERNPKVQWVTLPSLDAMNHIHGTIPNYAQLLIHIDSLIGDFVKSVHDLGQKETRAIAIITDHGVSDVYKNLDIRKNLKEGLGLEIIRGESVHLLTEELKETLADFEEKDGYFVINGNLSAYLYFRDSSKKNLKEGWRKKLLLSQLENYPTLKGKIDLLSFLAQQEGVGLLACQQNDSTIWIRKKDKTAIISKNKFGYRYSPINGDPLKYSADTLASKLIDKEYYTNQDWLKHTINSDYPDAIYRLYQLMTKAKVGDILICSEKGYDLAKDYELFVGNYKGGHGGLHKDLLNVPYILCFPNQAAEILEYARSETIGKMLKNYLFSPN